MVRVRVLAAVCLGGLQPSLFRRAAAGRHGAMDVYLLGWGARGFSAVVRLPASCEPTQARIEAQPVAWLRCCMSPIVKILLMK